MLDMAEAATAHRTCGSRPGHASRASARWWLSFFMYYASGPPPARLRQLLALVDAGLVRFVGADMSVAADPESGHVRRDEQQPRRHDRGDRAHRRSHRPALGESLDERAAATAAHPRGDRRGRGDRRRVEREHRPRSVTGAALHLKRSDGTGHPRRHALGAFTSRQVAGAFARPHFNAPAFRQNDVVARCGAHDARLAERDDPKRSSDDRRARERGVAFVDRRARRLRRRRRARSAVRPGRLGLPCVRASDAGSVERPRRGRDRRASSCCSASHRCPNHRRAGRCSPQAKAIRWCARAGPQPVAKLARQTPRRGR